MSWELILDLEAYEPDDAFASDGLGSACVSAMPDNPTVAVHGKIVMFDQDHVERAERARRAINVARAMYERGLLTDETLAATYPLLWDKEARKRAADAECKRAVTLWRDLVAWFDEFKPSVGVITSTGLASVTLAKLGTSEASYASRKIRDWHKVTRYNLHKAQESNEPEAYVLALRFVMNLLTGFLNTRYWAIRENARSVEDRALGGNNCKYNAVGAPKSTGKLVIHNQLGVRVSASLKRAEPVYIPPQVDSPEHPTEAIQPFPKVQHKKRRGLSKWE